jgi:radical SAM superfamily enzyme YgiQ (UPF0313 family)
VNVLLINPNREQMPWPAVPIGLCAIATAVERAGHEVRVLDLTFSRDLKTDVLDAVQQHEPDVIGITIRNIDNCNFESPFFYLTEIRDSVVRACREARPSSTVVIGGSAVNVSPRQVFDYLEADYALVGEGEESLPLLLHALSSGGEPARVCGLLAPEMPRDLLLPILDTGRMARGEPLSGRATVSDLNASARSEAWRWVDVRRYALRGGPYPIQTKRGCALKCSYCVYNNIEGHAYRLRSAVSVADEIEEAFRDHRVQSFDFVDSTFNLPLSHARAICEELERRALPLELSTMGLNPAGLTAELLGSMKRAGFRSVMCTPESASDVTLKSLQKGFTKRAVVRAAELLRAADLPTYWFFMLGAPGETMDTVRETLEFCHSHVPPDHVVLFSTGIRVYAGTPLERVCKNLGWFENEDPLFLPSWYLSPELDLDELYSTLVRAAADHPNWMTNAETVLRPAMGLMMKKAFQMIGWKGPFWVHLPKVFRWATRLGTRQRGLSVHAANVRGIKSVAHHGR